MFSNGHEKIFNVLTLLIVFTGIGLVGPQLYEYVSISLGLSPLSVGVIFLVVGAFMLGRD